MVTITLELVKDVERKARDAGLLTSETITAWIESELERKRREAAANLTVMMDKLQANFRAQYGDLTEEEAQAMIDEWIDEADEEIASKGDRFR